MSKRDDDSASDMDVGMTTAERRRRRRRGGGLRVPSDNVPRRTNPPVVAPVPEDPSLAMSIAYSFTNDASEPIPRVEKQDMRSGDSQPVRRPDGEAPPPQRSSRAERVIAGPDLRATDPSPVPRFAEPLAPEAMPTVIDPPSSPVEVGDFEMKTREMSAVDLEALGLSESTSNPGMNIPGAPAAATTLPGIAAQPTEARRREDTTQNGESESTPLDVEDLMPAADDSGGRPPISEAVVVAPPDNDGEDFESRSEVDIEIAVDGDASTSATGVPRVIDEASAVEDGGLFAPALTAPQPAHRRERLKTVALSDEDLEEVREAVRAATVASPQAQASSNSAIRPAPPSTPPVNQPRTTTPGAPGRTPPQPTPPPPLSFKSDTSQPGIKPVKVPDASGPRPADAPRVDQSNRTQPLTALDVEPLGPHDLPHASQSPASDRSGEQRPLAPTPPMPPVSATPTTTPKRPPSESVPEIDIQEIERGAETSGEIEVSIEDSDGEKPVDVVLEALPDVSSAPMPAASRTISSDGAAVARTTSSDVAHRDNAEPRRRPASVPPPVAPTAAQTNPGVHAQPPPVPVESKPKAPPSPPPKVREAKSPPPKPIKELAADKSRGKPWFADLFDEDYLRTLPFLTPQATQAEAEFAIDAMGLVAGAQVLDVGCGYGRHAMEMAARGFHVVGLDLSTPLLVRGGEESARRGLQINFVRGDMRELDFEAQFDGAYCLFSTFGYFDDETNKKTVANIARALKPGGKVLIEILNRDYVIADLPTRVWWEGDGCVVLEEVELNYFSSRIQVNRSVVFDDGRQLEQEISVRAYSLHEVGKLMHAAGFRVLEVSGGYHTRGRFFGNQSRHIIVLAERKDAPAV